MVKKCDHRSVGMLVWRDGKILLIERKRPPFGFAPPAGHLDNDDDYEVAAKRELLEEVGLDTINIELLTEGKKDNPCRREDGSWHYWKIYNFNATGEINKSDTETKQAKFFSTGEIVILAELAARYTAGEISDDEWIKSPGLEPVWCEWFKELKIIN